MVLLFTRKFNWVCIPQPPPSTPPWLSSTPPSCPRVSRVYLGSTEGRERNPGRAWKRFLLFFSSLPVLLLSGRRLFEKKWACQRRSEHSDLARNALLYWIFPHLFCTFLGVGVSAECMCPCVFGGKKECVWSFAQRTYARERVVIRVRRRERERALACIPKQWWQDCPTVAKKNRLCVRKLEGDDSMLSEGN